MKEKVRVLTVLAVANAAVGVALLVAAHVMLFTDSGTWWMRLILALYGAFAYVKSWQIALYLNMLQRVFPDLFDSKGAAR